MTILDAIELSRYWISAGGPVHVSAEWVGIALAESSGDTGALSSTGAIGLWQIEFFNAGIGGGTVADLYDPSYNAHVAVLMSGGGTNCAAWDTAYADINASGRYTFLGYPEYGSAAYNNILAVAGQLGTDYTGGGSPGSEPSLASGIDTAMADVVLLARTAIPNLEGDMLANAGVIAQIYTRGWVPWMFSGP